MWSWSLDNEEPLTHWGLLRREKKKKYFTPPININIGYTDKKRLPDIELWYYNVNSIQGCSELFMYYPIWQADTHFAATSASRVTAPVNLHVSTKFFLLLARARTHARTHTHAHTHTQRLRLAITCRFFVVLHRMYKWTLLLLAVYVLMGKFCKLVLSFPQYLQLKF